MRPVKFNGTETVIVNVNPEEKEHTYIKGTDGLLDLRTYPDASDDGRVRQPTTGIVLSSTNGVIPDGSYVVFHHNSCANTRSPDKNIYTINFNMIFAYVPPENIKGHNVPVGELSLPSSIINLHRSLSGMGPEGIKPVINEADMIPLWPTAFIQRIYSKPLKTSVFAEVRPHKEYTLCRIVKVPGDIPQGFEVNEGDIVVMFEKSDYELNFASNGFSQQLLKINIEQDVLAIIEKDQDFYDSHFFARNHRDYVDQCSPNTIKIF